MMRNKSKSCFTAGFTLLELLIAIALMDVIALTLYSSMYIGFRAKKNSHAILKPYQTVTPAFEYLREDFSNVLTPNGILAGPFVGEDVPWENQQDSDTLNFFNAGYHPSDGEIASNIIEVQYALADDTVRSQVVLKRYVTKNLLAPQAVEPASEEVVCRGLCGFDVKYYDGSTWLDSWDSAANDNKLPLGVQVTLTLLNDQVRTARVSDDERFLKFTRVFMLSTADQSTQEQDEQGQSSQAGS